VENQSLTGYFLGDGKVRFRFSPKNVASYNFEIKSNISELNAIKGGITSFLPSPTLARHPSEKYPNWWTDDPNPECSEGIHLGAKTVSKWREAFLKDFAKRMERCVYN